MLLGALLDLGVNVERVISAIKYLEDPEFGYQHIDIAIDEVTAGRVPSHPNRRHLNSSTRRRHGSELIAIVEKAAAGIYMSDAARAFASKVIRTIIEAEAELHKTSFEDAHLHEVALIDTAAEIIGCAVALDDLHLFEEATKFTQLHWRSAEASSSFRHGIVSAPAPATLAILQSKNFPFHGGPIEKELATPTGTSLLVNLAERVTVSIRPLFRLKVGYGAGTKEYPELPAVLRLTLGEASEMALVRDEIAVLETNIDDVIRRSPRLHHRPPARRRRQRRKHNPRLHQKESPSTNNQSHRRPKRRHPPLRSPNRRNRHVGR